MYQPYDKFIQQFETVKNISTTSKSTIKQIMIKKQAEKSQVDKTLLYSITQSLAETFKKLSSIKLPQNQINKFNIYLYEGHKAKFVPQVFLNELCEETLQIKQLLQLDPVKNIKWKKQYDSPRGFGASTPRFDFEFTPVTQRQVQKTMKKFSKSSNMRVSFNLTTLETKQQNFSLPTYKQEDDNVQNKIFNYGVFLFEMAVLVDTKQKNKKKLQDLMEDLEKKYGKLYMNFIKEILAGEIQTWDQVLSKLKSIGKFKTSEEEKEEDQKKSALNVKKTMKQIKDIQNELNIISMKGTNICTGYRYLHFFPDDTQFVILINLQDLNGIFYEISKLNINFTIPKFHRSLALPALNEYKIFLLGGQGNNQIYAFDRKDMSLSPLAQMMCNTERSHFTLCHIQQKFIYIIGGKVDGEITQQCEYFNIQTKQFVKIADLNIPSFDSCCCNYNDQFIYKFGGVNHQKKLIQEVEQYDLEKNRWRILQIIQNQQSQFQFLKLSQCICLNPVQILIFGGKNHDNISQDSNVFFNIFEAGQQNIFELDSNTGFKLPQKWNLLNGCILDERGIFCIQSGGAQQKNTVKVQFSGINEWRTVKTVFF